MPTKKSLGQNFLTSRGAIIRVIDAAEPFSSDFILEIGPGAGALTHELLERGQSVIAVETDLALIPRLEHDFASFIATEQLRVLPGDIRSFDESNLRQFGETYDIVANIPYYLTGLLFRKFLSASFSPQKVTFIVQKEVAERIMMRDGKGSLLSMSIRAFGEPESHGVIKRGSFNPIPKVDSAIISIDNISRKNFSTLDPGWFFTILRAGFGHKRKQLKNNLLELVDQETIDRSFSSLDLNPKTRAEELSIEQWFALAKNLEE